MEGASNAGSPAASSGSAAPSTTTEGATTGQASNTGSPPVAAREAARPGSTQAMRETFARERAKRTPGGTGEHDVPRAEGGRFAPRTEQTDAAQPVKPVDEKSASRPKPEGGQPDKSAGEGQPDDERIPKAAFQERLSRERKKQEQLSAKLEGAEMRARKAEEAFRLAVERANAVEQRWREGAAYDPRDDRVARYELAEKARQAAQRVDGEAAQRRQAEVAAQAEIETREATRAEVNAVLARYDLVSFDEAVSTMANALSADPNADLEQTVKRLHEAKLARGYVKAPPPQAAAPVPTLSRAASNGASGIAPAGHGLDALKATFRREMAKQQIPGR